MGDTSQVTLGIGTLYLNGVDVGFLKGNVELTYGRTIVDFKPAGTLGPVKRFVTAEEVILSASVAELNTANLKLAMGLAESISASASYPSFTGGGSGYSATASASYDVLTFGGAKTIDEMPLEFVHTRQDGKDIVLVLYKVAATPSITLPFSEDEVVMTPLSFQALHLSDRAEGDQVGFWADQVLGT